MALAGTETEEDFKNRAYDPLLPVVVLRPLLGFPEELQLKDEPGYVISIRDRLQDFRFIDNDKKRDICSMSIIDDDGQLFDPKKLVMGAVFEVAWGYKGRMSDTRVLIVRKINIQIVQGRKWARKRRGYIVNIECYDRTLEFHGIAPTSNDLFENKPLATIVKTIAERMGYHENKNDIDGLEINIQPSELNEPLPSIQRVRGMTYVQFLTWLADRHGLTFKVGKKGMYFGIRQENQPTPHLVDANGSTLLGLSLDGDLTLGAPAGLQIVSYDPGQAKTSTTIHEITDQDKSIIATPIATTPTDANEQQLGAEGAVEPGPSDTAFSTRRSESGTITVKTQESNAKNPSILKNRIKFNFAATTKSRHLATKIKAFYEKIKKKWKLKMRLVGDPHIYARHTINLTNFETELLDGQWYISEARHIIDSGGYIVELMGNRNLKVASPAKDRTITNTKKTPLTEEDKKLAYPTADSIEPINMGTSAFEGQLGPFNASINKTSHRTETGNFVEKKHTRR